MQARDHVHFISRYPIEDSNGETVKRIELKLVELLVAPYLVPTSGRLLFGSEEWSDRIGRRSPFITQVELKPQVYLPHSHCTQNKTRGSETLPDEIFNTIEQNIRRLQKMWFLVRDERAHCFCVGGGAGGGGGGGALHAAAQVDELL